MNKKVWRPIIFFASAALVGCHETAPRVQPDGGDASDGSTLDDGALSDGGMFPTGPKVVQVAAGESATCVVRDDESVWCWGALPGEAHPVMMPDAGPALTVAVGSEHACALKTDHSLWCWGDNTFGQLGDGTNSDRNAPVAITSLGRGVASISARRRNTCAVKIDGSLWCWGENSAGQLADGSSENRNAPTQILALGDRAKKVSIGYDNTCAVTIDGGLWCWEHSYNISDPELVTSLANAVAFVSSGGGQACVIKTDNTLWCGLHSFNQITHVGGSVAAVSISESYGCAIKSNGSLWCWGINSFGQVSGPDEWVDPPIQVAGLDSDVTAVSTGGLHTCALSKDGTLRCWGSNNSGQIGNNDTGLRPGPLNFQAISISHKCAIKADHSLWCWGSNINGGVGDGTTINRPSPVQVTALGNAVAAIVGSSCAVKTDNSVWCWGDNANGQVGDGTTTNRSSPVQVIALGNNAKQISTDATCAIHTNGSLSCWGDNSSGQVGDDTLIDRTSPVPISTLGTSVVHVSGTYLHKCAIKADNSLWCWGFNRTGGIGNGTLTNQSHPVAVSNFSTSAVNVSLGATHTCAVKDDRSLWCWGHNEDGQLGDGTTTPRTSPVRVSALGNSVVSVTAGGSHTCAIVENGSLWCWGKNDFGQLGDGTNIGRATPHMIPTPAPVESVASRAARTCALLRDKTVWCWGNDEQIGALGRGDVLRVRSPVVVTFPTS